MTNEFNILMDRMENIQNNMSLIATALGSKEFVDNKTVKGITRLLEENDNDTYRAIHNLKQLKRKHEENQVSGEEFLDKNIKFLLTEISEGEDFTFKVSNSPTRPYKHQFHHDTLINFLLIALKEMKQRKVNENDVTSYVKNLILLDIEKYKKRKQENKAAL